MKARINIVWLKLGRCAFSEEKFSGRQPNPTTVCLMYISMETDLE